MTQSQHRDIPIFPLSGAILLPGGHLPLNIFEPRYLAMVDSALSGDRLIGMLQPKRTDQPMGEAEVYDIGGLGRLSAFSETADNRYLITLTGIARFRRLAELPLDSGGFRVCRIEVLDEAPSLEIATDQQSTCEDDFFNILRRYFHKQGFEAQWDQLRQIPLAELVSRLGMLCPFSHAEKQGLLEAKGLDDRLLYLQALMQMATQEPTRTTTDTQTGTQKTGASTGFKRPHKAFDA